jgi:choline dehydrogenase-like flavoprotein
VRAAKLGYTRSVFPTSGTANPTLMIIAMALRLADWLKVNYFKA